MIRHDYTPNRGFQTLAELLHWRALHQPDRTAYIYLSNAQRKESEFTYKQLDLRSRSIGAALRASGMEGKQILLLYPPGLEYIAAFFGCLYAGAIAIPAYLPRSQRSLYRIQAIVADAHVLMVLTTSQVYAYLDRWFAAVPELATLQWLATDTHSPTVQNEQFDHSVANNHLMFLQYTSGSTGKPKGVMVSHANVLHNLAMICEQWKHTPESVGVSWLPIFHDMGLIAGVLQPLYAGFPAILMAPITFLQHPLGWLEVISRYGGTTSCAPNFAYELCIRRFKKEDHISLDLSRWKIAVNGAEPVRAETLDAFVETFGPYGFRREAFIPGYGLAEGTLMVTSNRQGDLPLIKAFDKSELEHHGVESAAENLRTQRLVGCGSPAAGQEVIIAHPDLMCPCQPGEVGEIWVSGASVAQGYWGNPVETAQTFGAYLADSRKGPFLRTGDLGFFSDNQLFVTGRLKDLIIIRGRNHYPRISSLRHSVAIRHSVQAKGPRSL